MIAPTSNSQLDPCRNSAVNMLNSMQKFNNINLELHKTINEIAQAKLKCAKAQDEKANAFANLKEQEKEIYRLIQNFIQG